MFSLLSLPPAIVALKTAVATHLGVAAPTIHARLDRCVANLAATLAIEGAEALARLGSLSVREVCLLLAEGPTEQTRACLLPEEVHPKEHGGLDGHVEAKDEGGRMKEEDISSEMPPS